MRLRWSARAERELWAVCEYIAKDKPGAADIFFTRVQARARRVARFPQSGRQVPEIDDPSVREIFFGNYRLVYRIESGTVFILTVFEGHRLFDPEKIK
ncbi:MAG: type II toxin-antitoxin system RelE/ParE family toxin [Bdellovibrionota bacterium]